jgi:SAM-dependent methyltransferase
METAPLKSFATWARNSLIREVAARIAVVLAPASVERVERLKAVDALEKAVSTAGGGVKGKASVADKVAYTWFNRIIALRFMDANGYTGIGVVSPQLGVEADQPEILAEAKRGNIDAAVVGPKTRETVTALLNGTRRSDDAQGEAYALLLADYCRYWNRAMPFMFEREGDFTELLIPANLLADDSVPSRAVKVLTKDVCQDVEVIGWLYQFYISERKDEVFAGFKKNKKAGADEIPAATQLFTPHWIVRYLVENSLGRLWMLNRPSSRLVDQMLYYIAPVDEETDFLKISRPEEIRVIDPACGSGHMLTYAFDLLYAIYEEEGYAPVEVPGLILTNNLYGVEIDPRAGALAAFALSMKARAKQRSFFNKNVAASVCVLEPVRFTSDEIDLLLTRAGDKHAESAFWNQFEYADTMGSLIQTDRGLTARLAQQVAQLDDGGDILLADVFDRARQVVGQAEVLSVSYHVVVANPPYMGSKNMNAALAEFANSKYPDAKADLMTMFMRRAFKLTLPDGYWAMINLPSWMFLTTFVAFRKWLLDEARVQSLVHLGRGVFGSDFGSVAFVFTASSDDVARVGVYRRLFTDHVDVRSNEVIRALFLNTDYNRFEVSQASFAAIPGEPLAYWFPEAALALFKSAPALGDRGRAAIGMVTGEDSEYLRRWFEVGFTRIGFGMTAAEAQMSDKRWFPYAKGGDFRRWAGNYDYVVNWASGGAELQTRTTADGLRIRAHNFNLDRIFRPGITWTAVTAGRPSFRIAGDGFLFSNAAGIYQSVDYKYHLALLNSSATEFILGGLNPTVNLLPSYLSAVPTPVDHDRGYVQSLSERAVHLSNEIWDWEERSWNFQRPFCVGFFSKVELAIESRRERWQTVNSELMSIQRSVDDHFAKLFDLRGILKVSGQSPSGEEVPTRQREVVGLVSYFVGCLFGRYALEEPGLILASQGSTLQDYLLQVPNPSFGPDQDNVIPVVDGDWFEDDIVARFRHFLRAAFGEQHLEENLRFVTESLGVTDVRDYFVKSFYKDHVQRYKKRPIYWLFSSPRGSFNALIYMHRYTPSTVSTVLNEYLREYRAKLSSSLQQQEHLAAGSGTPRQQAAAQKEADRLRKVLLELEAYEHDVLYPLASRQLAIDLDDGVKVNYPKFGAALKKIPGLEASDE